MGIFRPRGSQRRGGDASEDCREGGVVLWTSVWVTPQSTQFAARMFESLNKRDDFLMFIS